MTETSAAATWPPGTGEMARRIRDHDWGATLLGPVEGWPPEWRSAVTLMLDSAFPTFLTLGPDLIAIHNDAYRPLLGTGPDALGRPMDQVWCETWPEIARIVRRVVAGEAMLIKDFPLIIERTGTPEQRYFTFSYSPIRADSGSVSGVQALVVETTEHVRMTETLRRNSADYRAFIAATQDMIFRTNADFTEMRQLDGRGFVPDLSIPRRGWMDRYVDRRDHGRAADAIATAIRARSPLELEHRVQRLDGGMGWVSIRAVPIFDAAGEISEWFGTGRDVTERRMAQDRQGFLLELGDLLRTVTTPSEAMDAAAELLARRVGAAVVHFVAVDADGDSHQVLAAYSDGRLPDSGMGPGRISDHGSEWGPQMRRGEAVFSDDHAARPAADATVQQSLGIRSGSAIPLIRGGRLVAVFSTGSPEPRRWSRAEKALLREVAERIWDMVERARAEQALAEREARLDAILDTAKDYAIFSMDAEGRVETWSRGAEEVFGWTEDEIRGRMMDAAFTPEDRAADIPKQERRIAREQGLAPDVRWHLRKDGTRIFIEGVVRPLTDTAGRLRGYVKVGQDVTERRAMQSRLRESEAMFRQFADATRDVIWIRDARDMQFTYVSPAFNRVYGTDLADLMAGNDLHAWAALIHPEDRDATLANMRRVRMGERVTHEFRIRRPSDGHERWIRNTDFPIRDGAGRITSVAGIGTDITELKRAQMTLAASEYRFRTLVEGIPQMVWRAAPQGAILWVSPQGSAFSGRLPERALGSGWLDIVHPEDRPKVAAAWDHAAVSGKMEVMLRARRGGGGDYVWFQLRALPIRNDRGGIIEWLGTSTDIQAIHDAQERQALLMTELQHRTRNLMAVVTAMMEATLRHHPDTDGFAPVFRGRIAALSRVNGLLSRISDDSRITFDELLQAELSAHGMIMGDDAGPQVTLDGPRGVRLRSATVQTFALALHELATNAVKYGALSVPEGRLSVRWRLVNGGGIPRLRAEWREAGAPMPAPGAAPRGSGYGRTLIERALPYQLGAEISYDLTADGVHCVIVLPLSSTEGPPHD